jgi:hypothetical protein
MLAALEESMPAGTRWTHPDGGMFLWIELPHPLNGEALFPKAIEQKIAFVPGAPFFAADPQTNTIRLNYSNRPPELIREGMRRLGAVIAAEMLRLLQRDRFHPAGPAPFLSIPRRDLRFRRPTASRSAPHPSLLTGVLGRTTSHFAQIGIFLFVWRSLSAVQ